ncbi:MAG: glycosyltransferase family 1 protein [Bacteroidota bacterium]
MITVLLDGVLLAESEMLQNNRNGMIRIAEEILYELVKNNQLDISFMNTMYSKKYDAHLRSYLQKHYPQLEHSVVSKVPRYSSQLKGIHRAMWEIAKLFSLQVNTISTLKGDIFHSFYYPFPENIRNNHKLTKSITLLDIIPLRFKGYDKKLIALTKQVLQSVVPNYAIAISEFTKQDVLAYDKNIDAERVFVVPLAASKELFFQNVHPEDRYRVQKKYGLPEKYFLCISSTDIRKNIEHLIHCFNLFMLQEKPNDLYLVLTGNTMSSYSLLDSLNISSTVRKKIIITEKYIENEDLSAVYSNALCFFFMSFYEGFGLPVLEAMQCGVPVVTSNVSSMPEVAGNAAILIDPQDTTALCNTMQAVYNHDALRKKYSELGLARSKEFSWQKSAVEYAKIFKTIAANPLGKVK